jgi:hypothetical protein
MGLPADLPAPACRQAGLEGRQVKFIASEIPFGISTRTNYWVPVYLLN